MPEQSLTADTESLKGLLRVVAFLFASGFVRHLCHIGAKDSRSAAGYGLFCLADTRKRPVNTSNALKCLSTGDCAYLTMEEEDHEKFHTTVPHDVILSYEDFQYQGRTYRLAHRG